MITQVPVTDQNYETKQTVKSSFHHYYSKICSQKKRISVKMSADQKSHFKEWKGKIWVNRYGCKYFPEGEPNS